MGSSENFDEEVKVGQTVPLFPLPNVVLFPNALLPLHIFEERYKAMTADALSGNRQIAIALLSTGWQNCYYARPAIEPVVCIGTIVSYERLHDGKFNFLLRGEKRVRIEQEIAATPSELDSKLYRLARVQVLAETNVMEIDLSHERRRLETLLVEGPLGRLPLVRQMHSLLRSAMRTADLADLVAFHLLDDVSFKQSILADADVRRRVNRLLSALSSLELPISDQILYDVAAMADPTRN